MRLRNYLILESRYLFLLNKNHLSINQELIPNLLKMTLPVLLIFHAFIVLFDDTKK